MSEALVAGHICLDIIPELKSGVAFEPGRLIEAGPAVLSTGGAVSNTGLSLSKLGVETRLVARVGSDVMGRAVRDRLELVKAGASHGLLDAGAEPTSYTIVINSVGTDRMFLHAPGANATFRASDVADSEISSARLLHFGYPPLMKSMFQNDGEELATLLRRAKALGVTTSLDMSLPDSDSESGQVSWEAILANVLPYVDIFLPSVEELLFMMDRRTYDSIRGAVVSRLPLSALDRIADRAIAAGCKMVGIKLGSRGFLLKVSGNPSQMGKAQVDVQDWAGFQVWHPVFQVEVQGTTGAGDATIAGFLYGILKGWDPVRCSQAAAAVGASCCEYADAVTGVQDWDRTEARLASGWPTVPLDLDDEWEPRLTGFVRTYAPPRD